MEKTDLKKMFDKPIDLDTLDLDLSGLDEFDLDLSGLDKFDPDLSDLKDLLNLWE